MSLPHLDLLAIVRMLGPVGLSLIVFAESGLFFGFFLPGDSLLFSAGLLTTLGFFGVWPLAVLVSISAILGDSVGFWFGVKVGPKIFSREDSLFFHKQHIEQTEKFYEKYGPRTIILARFVPIVRTFAPILAGVGRMKYKKFLLYNIIGGVLWAFALVFLGYFLGALVPRAENYISLIAAVIIVVSFLPVLNEFRKTHNNNQKKKL